MGEIEISRNTFKKSRYNLRRSCDSIEENIAILVHMYQGPEPQASGEFKLLFDAFIEFREALEAVMRGL